MKVSKGQFNAYERVRKEGQYNMFDPNARTLTGLDKETYMVIIKDYDNLSSKYGGE